MLNKANEQMRAIPAGGQFPLVVALLKGAGGSREVSIVAYLGFTP